MHAARPTTHLALHPAAHRPATLLPAALLLAALLLAGCGEGRDAGPRTEFRDSAGVTIVLNSGDLAPGDGGWLLTDEPLLGIGTFAGDSVYQLYDVEGARRLADGRIVVANAGSGDLRVYDASGGFVRSIGRKGEGPGEYQNPSLAGVLGPDTLVVVDLPLRRISLVHPEAGFLSSATMADELGGSAFPQGMFEDRTVVLGGGFYWSSSSGGQLTGGYTRPPTSYASASLDGKLVTEFGEFPGAEFFMQVRNEGGGVMMSATLVPFGRHPMAAVSPDQFFFGSGDSWEVEAYDPGGTLQRLIRLDRAPTPVTSADADALLEERVEEAADPSAAPAIRERFSEMPIPDFMPAFASLHADALGYLWVEAYRPPGDVVPTYWIFDPDGRLVGRIGLPAEMEILDIGADYLLALYQDELDVEYLKLYGLQRPPASPVS